MTAPKPSIPNYDESRILDSVDRFRECDVRPQVRELDLQRLIIARQLVKRNPAQGAEPSTPAGRNR